MNGKGDKWRGGWTSQYADNHNKIFGEKMKRVFMFDVDGTLTPSRQKMTPKFEKFFTKWAEKNKYDGRPCLGLPGYYGHKIDDKNTR